MGKRKGVKKSIILSQEEYLRDLDQISAAKVLVSNPERAICIRVALGKGMFLDYWVENNKNVVECLDKEYEDVKKLIHDSK